MKKTKTEFVIGELYWHKYPYDADEHEMYFDISPYRWERFGLRDERVSHMLTYLGPCGHSAADLSPLPTVTFNIDEFGYFIYGDRKILVYFDDLCMVKSTERLEEILEKYDVL